MKYYASKTANFDDTKANAIGQEMEALHKKHGALTPEIVVGAAQRKSSAMHNQIQWDDDLAAAAYRRQQARNLIGKIVIHVKGEEVRAFHNITVHMEPAEEDSKPQNIYISYRDVAKDQDMEAQLLESARRSLTHFSEKYKTLASVSRHIDAALEEIEEMMVDTRG